MAFHYPDHGLTMDAAAASSPNPSFSAGAGGGEREKAAVAAHPLYERLLEAHVACLRVATPVDQLRRIDAQIAARPPPLAAAITDAVFFALIGCLAGPALRLLAFSYLGEIQVFPLSSVLLIDSLYWLIRMLQIPLRSHHRRNLLCPR